jgi:hypothetical protein
VVEIRRTKGIKPRYEVSDRLGNVSAWAGRFGREGVRADIDGERWEVRREGGKRFVLTVGDRELATADRAKRNRWTIAAAGDAYELKPVSFWRTEMELRGPDTMHGRILRARRPRRVVCDLSDDLPAEVQAFVGFVVMALWDRQAAIAGATAASGGAVASSS